MKRLIISAAMISFFAATIFQSSMLVAGDLDDLYLFWLIKPKYEDASDFSEGLAAVQVNGKWGFINKQDKMIIQPQFECPLSYKLEFHEGLAAVHKNGNWGFIDKNGNTVIDYKFRYRTDFKDGIALVMTKSLFGISKFGFIDKKGEYIFDKKFDKAEQFSEGLAKVQEDDLYGYINKDGEYAFEEKFFSAGDFHEGLAPVQKEKNGLFGYIDQKGNYVIEPKYDRAIRFFNGSAIVFLNKKQLFIDKKGKITNKAPGSIINPGGLESRCQKKKCGYVNRFGVFVIGAMFDDAFPFSDRAARVKIKNKWGYIRLP